MELKYKNTLIIVVYKREAKLIKYLLLKRKLHGKSWELPRADIEEKISAIKTIKKEIKRQTNQVPYYIKKYSFQGKYKYEKINSNQEIIGNKYKLYSAEIKNSNIKLDSLTHLDYKFLDYKKAIEILNLKEERQSLILVNEKLLTIFHLKPKVSFKQKFQKRLKRKKK